MKTLTALKTSTRFARCFLLLASGLAFMATGSTVHAGPIEFTIDDIDLTLENTEGSCYQCSASADADLPISFFLTDIGDSSTFDLFDLNFAGLSSRGFSGDLVTSVSFSAPSSLSSEAISGSFTFRTTYSWWFLNNENEGTLTYDPSPVDVTFSDGTAISLALSGGSDTCSFRFLNACSVSMGVSATASLTATPAIQAVPEPGTLALFGAGLVGFGVMRRRRLNAG